MRTHVQHLAAAEKAELCRRFLSLTRDGGLSGNQAAAAIGRSPAWFSANVKRFETGGDSALIQDSNNTLFHKRVASLHSDSGLLTFPWWFIPSAKFFWLQTNLNRDAGSVPEAVRRVISLPACPPASVRRLIACLNQHRPDVEPELTALPECPAALRDEIIRRERAGMEMVPASIRRQICAAKVVVRQYRNPTNADLDFISAPGTQMWITDPTTGIKRFIRAGDVIEADDATINFPVVIPWEMGGCPSSERYGVKVGRFQWLVTIDAGSRFVPGFSYTARPRASYRGEDVLGLMRCVARQHGIPRCWRLEQGVWKSNLVVDAVRLMGSDRITVHSPHAKPFIEGLFNKLWTKLSVWFPDSSVGRFRGEEEETCAALTACQEGHRDPRLYFPMLDDVLRAFREVIAEHNATPIFSENYGTWIPEERWKQHLAERPLARLAPENEWLFSPFVRDWTVRGMLVGGKVPLFEELSVPYDFSAPFLPLYDGAKVRCYFDPTDPQCAATVVLLQNFNNTKAGTVLGAARQINETTGYIRLVMGWADDPTNLGRLARQKNATALRSELRAIMPGGRYGYAKSEQRDGVSVVDRIETLPAATADGASRECATRVGPFVAANPEISPVSALTNHGRGALSSDDLSARAERSARFETENAIEFV